MNHDPSLLGDFDYIVYIDDDEKFRYSRINGKTYGVACNEIEKAIFDAIL